MIFLRGTASLGDWSNMRIAMLGLQNGVLQARVECSIRREGSGTIDKQERASPCTAPHAAAAFVLAHGNEHWYQHTVVS